MCCLAGCSTPKKPSSDAGADSGTDACTQNCPCVPITAINIVSVEFVSDDRLLKDYTTDWQDGGTTISKPGWTPAAQFPATHTMDKPVQVKVTIEVLTKNACPETGDLRGEGPNGIVFEKKGDSFAAGQHTVTLNSTGGKVPKAVQKLAFTVNWTTKGTSVPISPSTTSSTMYVTYDKPFGSDVTLKRMDWAVEKC